MGRRPLPNPTSESVLREVGTSGLTWRPGTTRRRSESGTAAPAHGATACGVGAGDPSGPVPEVYSVFCERGCEGIDTALTVKSPRQLAISKSLPASHLQVGR